MYARNINKKVISPLCDKIFFQNFYLHRYSSYTKWTTLCVLIKLRISRRASIHNFWPDLFLTVSWQRISKRIVNQHTLLMNLLVIETLRIIQNAIYKWSRVQTYNYDRFLLSNRIFNSKSRSWTENFISIIETMEWFNSILHRLFVIVPEVNEKRKLSTGVHIYTLHATPLR